jgi:lipoprotein-anchoring transpeptidase ErfK/SrfK
MSKNLEKRKSSKGIVLLVVAIMAASLMVVYFCISLYYTKHMFKNVTINGLDVSQKTIQQIREDLTDRADNYSLTITERNNKQEILNGKDFDLKLSYDDTLDDILASQNMLKWGIHLFKSTEYNLDVTAEYDSAKLYNLIHKLNCMNEATMVSPTDAYLQYSDENGLTIVPENMGTYIEDDTMLALITQAVENAEYELDLDAAGGYVAPNVLSDDQDLNSTYNLIQPYLDMVIVYHFDDMEEVLDRSVFYDWISETDKGTVEFDEEMIKSYVKSLASKYNTAYRSHEFETSYGETITVTTGTYGWLIDQATEREELYDILMSGESQDREPVYTQTAASHTGNDYGDTYVEVNLSAQHLFFYVDGKLLIETDFVSGNASKGWSTPGGIYPLTYKERNATLRGENYATPVSYWMPFNGNIGLHDSTWRSTYGKNIYKTNGSHGCINLPPSAAETIFENIEKGMPVVCYYLASTEYKSNDKTTTSESKTESTTESTTAQEATNTSEPEQTATVDNSTQTDTATATVDATPVEVAPTEDVPAVAEQVTTDTAVQMQ